MEYKMCENSDETAASNIRLRLPQQNFVLLIGRLVRDCELRKTLAGKTICSFDIAISKRVLDNASGQWKDADPTFVPVIIFGEQVENYHQRLKKGVAVHVEGKLQTIKWQAKDAIIRSRLECKASKIQVLTLEKDDQGLTLENSNFKPEGEEAQC
jgi:single-strand DNA-binding protein